MMRNVEPKKESSAGINNNKRRKNPQRFQLIRKRIFERRIRGIL